MNDFNFKRIAGFILLVALTGCATDPTKTFKNSYSSVDTLAKFLATRNSNDGGFLALKQGGQNLGLISAVYGFDKPKTETDFNQSTKPIALFPYMPTNPNVSTFTVWGPIPYTGTNLIAQNLAADLKAQVNPSVNVELQALTDAIKSANIHFNATRSATYQYNFDRQIGASSFNPSMIPRGKISGLLSPIENITISNFSYNEVNTSTTAGKIVATYLSSMSATISGTSTSTNNGTVSLPNQYVIAIRPELLTIKTALHKAW